MDFKQPPPDVFRSKVFQGYAAYGPHLYVLTGTSYDARGWVVNSQVASIRDEYGEDRAGAVIDEGWAEPVVSGVGRGWRFIKPRLAR